MTDHGFTLLELMITAGLMSMVFCATASILIMSQRVFYSTSVYGQLTQGSAQTLRSISREIGMTSPNTTPSHLNISVQGNGMNQVCFQIPVDWDNDGDADNGSLNPQVEWGAYTYAGDTQNGRLNDWVCYAVNNNLQLTRQVTDSSFAAIGGLNPDVVANNVQNFQVVKNANGTLSMTLTLQLVENVGHSATGRTYQSTFTSTTLLRNAVT